MERLCVSRPQQSQGFAVLRFQECSSGQIQGCQDATATLIRGVEAPGIELWSSVDFLGDYDQIFEHMPHSYGWKEDPFQNGALS